MSKELEAIQVLKANAILFDDGSDYGASMLEAIEVLDEYLTPPTEQEVCEALGEYMNEPVWFDNDGDIRITTQWVVKQLGKYGLNFMVVLPPHLVEMIGKFYKGKVKENEKEVK